MLIKKFVFLLMIGLIMLGLTGCSFMNRGPKIIALTVTPGDAYVIVNGVEYHHVSPQFIEVHPDRELLITAYKPGYKEAFYAVDNQLSTVGKIDAWASILILPFFGLFSDGAWELKEHNIRIIMEPLIDQDAINLEQQETVEAKRRGEVKFREQAVDQGPPPSPQNDEELKKEFKERQAKIAAEAEQAIDEGKIKAEAAKTLDKNAGTDVVVEEIPAEVSAVPVLEVKETEVAEEKAPAPEVKEAEVAEEKAPEIKTPEEAPAEPKVEPAKVEEVVEPAKVEETVAPAVEEKAEEKAPEAEKVEAAKVENTEVKVEKAPEPETAKPAESTANQANSEILKAAAQVVEAAAQVVKAAAQATEK